tara:strand:+ start:405 stop:791 length:387 start_codon:yes stop_codon:yes gene_type:complete
MPKKRLTEISEEYGIPFEESLDLVFKELEEEMVSGKGRNTWISEDGQRLLDEFIAMPVLYRGPIIQQPPNPNFVMVYLKEQTKKVKVRVPRRMQGNLTKGKLIYFEADNSGFEPKYTWIKTPQRNYRS